jgi:hypothetical protein
MVKTAAWSCNTGVGAGSVGRPGAATQREIVLASPIRKTNVDGADVTIAAAQLNVIAKFRGLCCFIALARE